MKSNGKRRAARVINAEDRGKLTRTWADSCESTATGRRLQAHRDRALFVLAWNSALRVSECLALDVGQLVYAPDRGLKMPKIRSGFELLAEQAKGGIGGHISVPRPARSALRAYLRAAAAEDWITRWTGPLFVRTKSSAGEAHGRLSKRAAQFAWERWQQAARISAPGYTWHDTRHTAVTRFSAACGGDAYQVALFARHRDLRTSMGYVHISPEQIDQCAEEMGP